MIISQLYWKALSRSGHGEKLSYFKCPPQTYLCYEPWHFVAVELVCDVAVDVERHPDCPPVWSLLSCLFLLHLSLLLWFKGWEGQFGIEDIKSSGGCRCMRGCGFVRGRHGGRFALATLTKVSAGTNPSHTVKSIQHVRTSSVFTQVIPLINLF